MTTHSSTVNPPQTSNGTLPSLSPAVTLNARGHTHVGRVRSSNQDSYLCDVRRQLFIVADGMGGHAGGEIASSLAVLNVRNFLDNQLPQLVSLPQNHPNEKIQQVIANSLNFACEKVYERGLEEPVLKGMGTTLTVLRIVDHQVYCGHVGDSRAYLIRCGYLYQLSADHSLVGDQIRAGLLTKEEAERHHLRNVVTRSIGYQESEDVDVFNFPLEDGDLLLLCSDGLHGKIDEAEIAHLCQTHGVLAVDPLIQAANNAGGDDNISAIVIEAKVK